MFVNMLKNLCFKKEEEKCCPAWTAHQWLADRHNTDHVSGFPQSGCHVTLILTAEGACVLELSGERHAALALLHLVGHALQTEPG